MSGIGSSGTGKGEDMAKNKTLEELAEQSVADMKRKRKTGLTIENLAKKGIGKAKPGTGVGADHKADTLKMVKTPWDHEQEKAGAMKVKNEP